MENTCKKMLHAGLVRYINALPLFTGFLQKAIDCPAVCTLGTPEAINALLKRGDIDIGLVSSIEALRYADRYVIYPSLGLAAKGPVLSVNLFSYEKVETLHQKRIAITSESATSAVLLRLLCNKVWRIEPKFVTTATPDQEHCSAFLLIGDKALTFPAKGMFVTDLSQCWYEWTGLPFLFALFAIRKDALLSKAQAIEEFVFSAYRSYLWGVQNHECIVAKATAQTGLSREQIKRYYAHFTYTIDKAALQGLKAFAHLLHLPIPRAHHHFT